MKTTNKVTVAYVKVMYHGSDWGAISNQFSVALELGGRDATISEQSELLSKWNEVAATFPQVCQTSTYDQARDFLAKTKGRGVLWLSVRRAANGE